METLNPELALYGCKDLCTRTKTVLPPISEVSTGAVSLIKNTGRIYFIRKEPGRMGKGYQIGILPVTYWVFLTTSNFLTWLGIKIYVNKLETSNNMQ